MELEDKIKELKIVRMKGFPVSTLIMAREILKFCPNDLIVLNILGNALSSLERYDEAIEVIDKAIKLSTENKKYRGLVTKAFTFFEKGSYLEAEEFYIQAFCERAPRQIDIVLYAECLIKRGEYSTANSYLSKCISESEKVDELTYYTLGVALRAEKKYIDALDYFSKAIKIDPDYEDAMLAYNDISNYLEFQKVK